MKNHCRSVFQTGTLSLCVCLLLSGCASFLWEREFYQQVAHPAQAEEALSSEELQEARSEAELKEVIINIIHSGLTKAEIDITDYQGELGDSLYNLLAEIQNKEPIGVFKVEYLSQDITHVLSNDFLTLTIIYHEDNQREIQSFSGTGELKEKVADALSDYAPRLTLETKYYDGKLHNLEELARSYYYDHPAWAMEMPVLTLGLYPSDGDLHRIIDLSMTYTVPDGVLLSKTQETEEHAAAILEGLPDFPPLEEGEEPGRVEAQKLLWLHDTLCAFVLHDDDIYREEVNTGERQGGDAYTAYGALVKGSAVSEGYAMAFKLLCDEMDLDCRVIRGQWNEIGHAWNLVRIGETWYHISAGLDDRGPTPIYDYFLFNDETALDLQFNVVEGQFYSSLPGVWTYEAIPPLAEEEVPEEDDETTETGDENTGTGVFEY